VVRVVVRDADAGVVEFDGTLDLAAQGQLVGTQVAVIRSVLALRPSASPRRR
jgi:hypothetical protein